MVPGHIMTNFKDIKIQFIERLAYKRRDFVTLIRIIIGYMNTNNRLFKMGIIPLFVTVVFHRKIWITFFEHVPF